MQHEVIERSWGYFEVLGRTPQLKFKNLVLLPGKSTSLQYHHHRDEFWTVLSGKGEALIDGKHYALCVDGTYHVASGIWHQLVNNGQSPLVIHEVQRGKRLEENDIIRRKRMGSDERRTAC